MTLEGCGWVSAGSGRVPAGGASEGVRVQVAAPPTVLERACPSELGWAG